MSNCWTEYFAGGGRWDGDYPPQSKEYHGIKIEVEDPPKSIDLDRVPSQGKKKHTLRNTSFFVATVTIVAIGIIISPPPNQQCHQ